MKEKALKSIPKPRNKIKKDIILSNFYENEGFVPALGN